MGILKMGEVLVAGDELRSASGEVVLRVQADGDVVLADPDGAVLWAAGTVGRVVAGLRVQADGDLVAFGPGGEVVWAASEHGGARGPGGGALVVQDDGEVVVRDAAGAVRWRTNTRRPEVVGPEAFTSFAVLLDKP